MGGRVQEQRVAQNDGSRYYHQSKRMAGPVTWVLLKLNRLQNSLHWQSIFGDDIWGSLSDLVGESVGNEGRGVESF